MIHYMRYYAPEKEYPGFLQAELSIKALKTITRHIKEYQCKNMTDSETTICLYQLMGFRISKITEFFMILNFCCKKVEYFMKQEIKQAL